MSEEDDDADTTTAAAAVKRPRAPAPAADQVLDNVLETVLQFLTSPRDRGAASLVSRSWHRAEGATRRAVAIPNLLAASPGRAARRFPAAEWLLLKGRPRFADFNLLPHGWAASAFRPWAAAIAAASFPCLQSLALKRLTIRDDDIALVARSLPTFRELAMVLCDGFASPGLAALAAHCRRLRVLDLIDCDLNEEEEEEAVDWVSKFPPGTTELESLSFECVGPPVGFDALEALVARSPCLRRLRVNQHVSLGQLRLLMARAPRLTHLGTGAFRTGDGAEEGLEAAQVEAAFVAASRSLVSLSGFRELAPEYLPAIVPACGNLMSLDLSYTALTAEQLLPVIGHCRNLETLWVLDTLRDEGLEAVAASCKNLRELRVLPLDANEDAEGSVSHVGLAAISDGCRELRSILYFCQRMTNEAVITMSKNCPELAVFRLCIMGRHRPDHVTGQPMDEGFGAIVRNCSKLTRLSLSGLLTDQAFEYIGKYGKSVRTLSVAFAGNSDLALQYVLQGCSKLEKLEIRDCPFGDAGLLSGLHHFYNMRFLWMSGCNLTRQGCKEVARQLPRMVVELIRNRPDSEKSESVEILYMYRSLDGPREDAPPFVQIL